MRKLMKNNIFVGMEETCEPPEWFDNVEPFLQKVLEKLKLDHWEVSVMFCNDGFIRNLNNQYRNIDSPTDVLSFEGGDEYADDDGVVWYAAGDIVISIDTLLTNCTEFAVTLNEELKRLLVHGILHLNGMDHSDNSPEQEMLIFQEKLLKEMKDEIIVKE